MTWEEFRRALNRKGWRVSTLDAEPRCPRHTYGEPGDFVEITEGMEIQFRCRGGKWFAICHHNGCYRVLAD